MALLAVFTGGERLFAVVTGPAIFALAEGFHGQSVARIGTTRFFLEQRIMAVTATHSRLFVGIMIEQHRSKAFGIFEHDFSRATICLNRHLTPQQTSRNEDHHTENPYSNFHKTPFSNNNIS